MLKTKTPYFSFLLLSLLITLSACGKEVVTNEEAQTQTGQTLGTGALVERTCTIAEYDRCVAQVNLFKKDIKKASQENEKCSNALAAYQAAELAKKNDNPKINEILKNYTVTTEQREYPFNSCGKVSVFNNKPWFEAFRTALENKKIPFVKIGRSLNSDDFTGGCFSPDANVAFFIGAETANVSNATESGSEVVENEDIYEFHLLKYDITANTIEETIMANGICTDENCPAVFSNREGAVIPMQGISKTEECHYKYYFDQNILIKDTCNAK